MSKAITKKNDAALACIEEMEDQAGGGFEGVDQDSKDKPYLIICQKGTPIADESNDAYIDGLKPGMIFNTATEEFYDGKKGISVIPCGFARKYIEKEQGLDGEFIGVLDPADPIVRTARFEKDGDKKVLMTSNRTQLADTRYHFVIYSTDDINWEPAVIKMKSTQIKKSKSWVTKMEKFKVVGKNGPFTPAMWWQKYKLSTKGESMDKYTWFGWIIDPDGTAPNGEVANYGKNFHDQVISGDVEIKETTETEIVDEQF